MPKSYAHGDPSYAGHVDVSSPDTDHPEWVLASDVDDAEVESEDATEREPGKKSEAKRPTPRKRS